MHLLGHSIDIRTGIFLVVITFTVIAFAIVFATRTWAQHRGKQLAPLLLGGVALFLAGSLFHSNIGRGWESTGVVDAYRAKEQLSVILIGLVAACYGLATILRKAKR